MMEIMIAGKQRLTSVKFQRKAMMVIMVLMCVVMLSSMIVVPAFGINIDANPEGTDKLNNVMGFIAGWSAKIGLVVAFFGALQTVLGFMNDDADGKVRGLKTLAAGFMVWGVAQSVNIFFT